MEKTILLVEDSLETRTIYATMLRHHGYRVVEAVDGAEGIRLAMEARPDLILMNISLPHVDGWTATHLLKTSPDTAAIPIVAVTAFVRPTDRAKAEAIGCVGYLDKPCDPTRLLEEVQRCLGSGVVTAQ